MKNFLVILIALTSISVFASDSFLDLPEGTKLKARKSFVVNGVLPLGTGRTRFDGCWLHPKASSITIRKREKFKITGFPMRSYNYTVIAVSPDKFSIVCGTDESRFISVDEFEAYIYSAFKL